MVDDSLSVVIILRGLKLKNIFLNSVVGLSAVMILRGLKPRVKGVGYMSLFECGDILKGYKTFFSKSLTKYCLRVVIF